MSYSELIRYQDDVHMRYFHTCINMPMDDVVDKIEKTVEQNRTFMENITRKICKKMAQIPLIGAVVPKTACMKWYDTLMMDSEMGQDVMKKLQSARIWMSNTVPTFYCTGIENQIGCFWISKKSEVNYSKQCDYFDETTGKLINLDRPARSFSGLLFAAEFDIELQLDAITTQNLRCRNGDFLILRNDVDYIITPIEAPGWVLSFWFNFKKHEYSENKKGSIWDL